MDAVLGEVRDASVRDRLDDREVDDHLTPGVDERLEVVVLVHRRHEFERIVVLDRAADFLTHAPGGADHSDSCHAPRLRGPVRLQTESAIAATSSAVTPSSSACESATAAT